MLTFTTDKGKKTLKMHKDTNGFFEHFPLLFQQVILPPQSAILLLQFCLMPLAWKRLIFPHETSYSSGEEGSTSGSFPETGMRQTEVLLQGT